MGRLGRGLTSEAIKNLIATSNALMEMNNINNQRISSLSADVVRLNRRLAQTEIRMYQMERELDGSKSEP